MGIGWPVGIVVVALIVLRAAVRLYNGLVTRRNAVDNAFSTIDVQMKLRCDLVPRVVDAVRGYMEHERGVLEQLTTVRAQATASGLDPATRLALDSQLGGLLSRVFAVAEGYPDLKAASSVVRTRILQMDRYLYLGQADEAKLINPSTGRSYC